MEYRLVTHSLAKRFKKQVLFKEISFELVTGQSLSISGPNGSGKTTLLKILATLLKPDQGHVEYFSDGIWESPEKISGLVGYCSPLVFAYDELSGRENLEFALRDKKYSSRVTLLLESFGLLKDADKPTGIYSTGMLQRLRCALALVNDPPVLLFDEPGSNLDLNGKQELYHFISRVMKDKITVIASNDIHELELCEKEIQLVSGNKKKF